MAGFLVATYGRIGVAAEAPANMSLRSWFRNPYRSTGMKQALEIDDLPELAELLTAAEAADYLRISEMDSSSLGLGQENTIHQDWSRRAVQEDPP
jgi:hypothetical protein